MIGIKELVILREFDWWRGSVPYYYYTIIMEKLLKRPITREETFEALSYGLIEVKDE